MDPIKIEISLKADKSLFDLAVYFGQLLLGLHAEPVKQPKERKAKPAVQSEGEITGKVVTKEEIKKPQEEAHEDKANPFDGVDDDNVGQVAIDEPEVVNNPPVVTMSHEDARKHINVARSKGIEASKIKAIIVGMGYQRLDEIPEDKLPEFVDKVEAL